MGQFLTTFNTLSAIDALQSISPKTESLRFLLSRIDTRNCEYVVDEQNQAIRIEPKKIEPDLQDIQQKNQNEHDLMNRFALLSIWSKKTFSNEDVSSSYKTWREAFNEAQALDAIARSGTSEEIVAMYYGGINRASAVFLRDYASELNEDDLEWCTANVIEAVLAKVNSLDRAGMMDVTDHDGSAAAASCLPILFDFVNSEEEKFYVNKVIVLALTHPSKSVRHNAAEGIRKELWTRNAHYASLYIIGALQYAKFERVNEICWRKLHVLDKEEREVEKLDLQNKREFFKDRFASGQLDCELDQINPVNYSSWYLLTSSLMIPYGSILEDHVILIKQYFTLFVNDELYRRERHSNREERYEIDHRDCSLFKNIFIQHLLHLEGDFEQYMDVLKPACNAAPNFVSSILIFFAAACAPEGKTSLYWKFWKLLSPTIQKIAISESTLSNSRSAYDRKKLVCDFLHFHTPWQKNDLDFQHILFGKDLILDFAINVERNPYVFGSLARLMYYFPQIFFNDALTILSSIQKKQKNIYLLSAIDTPFYLEHSLQYFLQVDQTGALTKKAHDSCLVLLDAVIETASARAYYLRENLIRSRRII